LRHLLAVAKVATRVAELRRQTEKKAGWTRGKWIAALTREACTGATGAVRIRALEQLGEALGYFKPEKVIHQEQRSLIIYGVPGAPPPPPTDGTARELLSASVEPGAAGA
jgi:hypothetical protein